MRLFKLWHGVILWQFLLNKMSVAIFDVKMIEILSFFVYFVTSYT